ncbi:MAG: hypothetical protein RJA76_246 [Bacteroidota bacterium]|jgi:hypothetical protein
MKKFSILITLIVCSFWVSAQSAAKQREYLVQQMTKMADPILVNLSQNTLKKNMPVESNNGRQGIFNSTYLEGFARMLSGMAPWLELGPDETSEGKLRKKYIILALKALKNGVDPKSPDYLNFHITGQSLVDAAFLSQALLRAPSQLLKKLDEETKLNLINALKLTRNTKPPQNNWLLFAATVETCIYELTGECEISRINYAIQKHMEWYKGDGVYGDGPSFHFDYYNSFVIHPMLYEVIQFLNSKKFPTDLSIEIQTKRIVRYAEILERMVSPEATYPITGRSLAYRFGNMQVLSLVAQKKLLPNNLSENQIRSLLFQIIKKQLEAPQTFDSNGWLRLGIAGHQTLIGETYISTGSLYLCSEAFLILGLPANDTFWQGNDADWTARKVYKGLEVPIDHAISE